MSFDDARKILTGSDTAATEYFKRTSSADLTTAFSPIVQRSMERVGVVQQYNNVLASAPGGSALAGQFDLNKYVRRQDARRPVPDAGRTREEDSQGSRGADYFVAEGSVWQEITFAFQSPALGYGSACRP